MAPLYAIVVALAIGASASETARPEHPFLLGLRARLAEAFAERPGERLFDVSGEREAAASQGVPSESFERLVQLSEEARAFQLGRRQEESQDAYNRALADVARRLGARVDRVLAAYGRRVRPEGAGSPAEVAARIRVLSRVNEQLGPAGQRRMAQRLRGYRSALDAMLVRDGGTITGSGASIDYLAYRQAGPTARAASDAAPLIAATYQQASLVAFTAEQFRELNSQPAAGRYVSPSPGVDVPAEAPAARPTSFTTRPIAYGVAAGSLDGVRIRDLMRTARELGPRRFGGWCLSWVKRAITRAGLMEPPPRDPRRERARMEARNRFAGMYRAFLMGRMTQDQLEELGLQPIIPSSVPWAVDRPELNGFFLVWAPTCAGFHARAGHVEYVIPRDDPSARGVTADRIPVKSDGTRGADINVLRRFSADPLITVNWVDGNAYEDGVLVHRGLGRVSQACLTVLAPLDID